VLLKEGTQGTAVCSDLRGCRDFQGDRRKEIRDDVLRSGEFWRSGLHRRKEEKATATTIGQT